MTRKDYVLIAEALKSSKPELAEDGTNDNEHFIGNMRWKLCCCAVADALQGDNGRFDRDRFLKACGIEG